MAGLGHQGGKYKPVGETAACPWVERQIGRNDIPEDLREVFEQAINRIDSDIPHFGGKHGVPTEAEIDDIEMLECALAKSGIELHVSRLFRYVVLNTRVA
jgi:hypothetical protein